MKREKDSRTDVGGFKNLLHIKYIISHLIAQKH